MCVCVCLCPPSATPPPPPEGGWATLLGQMHLRVWRHWVRAQLRSSRTNDPRASWQMHSLRTQSEPLLAHTVRARHATSHRGTLSWSGRCSQLLFIQKLQSPGFSGKSVPLSGGSWVNLVFQVLNLQHGFCAAMLGSSFSGSGPPASSLPPLLAVSWVSQACSCLRLLARLLPAGTFSPSPFPVLSRSWQSCSLLFTLLPPLQRDLP